MSKQSLAIVALTKESKELLKLHRMDHVHLTANRKLLNRETNIFVFAEAKMLPEVSDFIKQANSAHNLKALFLHEDKENWNWIPQMLDRANLRTLRNLIVHSDFTITSRILKAWVDGAQQELIASARVIDGSLLIRNCALQEIEVPAKDIPALKALTESQLQHFTVSESGSYLHWPKADIHLDFDTFRYYTDPEWKKRTDRLGVTRNKRFGGAVMSLRLDSHLKQSEIPGLSERQLRRIEKEGENATDSALKALAQAHKMTYAQYLAEVAKRLGRKAGEGA